MMDAELSHQIVVALRQTQLQMRSAMGISFALLLIDRVGSIVMSTVFLLRHGTPPSTLLLDFPRYC